MLAAIGILFILAWAVGLVAMPQSVWYVHVLLVVGLVAVGYRVLRPRAARP